MISRNPILSCALFVVLSLAGTLAGAAEPPAASSPEAVVQEFLKTMKAGQFRKSAELLHPEALEKFRMMLLPLVEAAEGEDQNDLLTLFQGVPDKAALKKLSPAEFFATFLGGLTQISPEIKEALASGTMATIGSVPEGDTIHVVCRTTAGVEGISITQMSVMSLKRDAGNWRVLLTGEMEGLAQALSNSRPGKV